MREGGTEGRGYSEYMSKGDSIVAFLINMLKLLPRSTCFVHLFGGLAVRSSHLTHPGILHRLCFDESGITVSDFQVSSHSDSDGWNNNK